MAENNQADQADPKLDALMQWLERRTTDTDVKVVERENVKDIKCEMGPALTEEQFRAYCQKMGDRAPKVIKAPIQKPK